MSEKYQNEIEEILRQATELTPASGPKKVKRNPSLAALSRIGRGIGRYLYPNSGRLLFIGLALLVSAVLVSAMFPGPLGPIVWLGLIGFILVYALFFAHPSENPEKLWRGRPIGPIRHPGARSTWWKRIQRRMRS